MDSTNASEIMEPSAVECPSNFTNEDSTRKSQADEATVPQANEIPKEIATTNPKKPERKNSKKPAKEGKLSLKRKMPTKENLPLKIKKANSLPTSQMVMESIKALKKRNGTSVEAILEHMEGHYKVDKKLIKRYVSRFLKSAVQKGIVEQLSGAGDDGRFKIKKAEKITKVEKKVNANQKMPKAEKGAKISQKLDDDQKKIRAVKVAKADRNENQKMDKGVEVTKVE